jgi:hypothetical protein
MNTQRKITAPNGDRYTVAQYLGWVRLNQSPCHYGHIGCAGWKRGPCSAELNPPELFKDVTAAGTTRAIIGTNGRPA